MVKTKRRRRAANKKSASVDRTSATKDDSKDRLGPKRSSSSPFRRTGGLPATAILLATALVVAACSAKVASGLAYWTPRQSPAARATERRMGGTDHVTVGEEPPPLAVDKDYVLLERIPHDTSAFTQGLTRIKGRLYEGTGLWGESELRELSPSDGTVLRSHKLDDAFFGEGIAHYQDADGRDRIIQITWREQTGFVYDAETFDVVFHFLYGTTTKEGWGIAYDAAAQEFIVSDGSHWLHFWDRDTLQEKRRVEVRVPIDQPDGTTTLEPLRMINELEYFDGMLLANVWSRDQIVRIDPSTGDVLRAYDFANLYADRAVKVDQECFNGISSAGSPGELFVTGKLWPHMYRVKLVG